MAVEDNRLHNDDGLHMPSPYTPSTSTRNDEIVVYPGQIRVKVEFPPDQAIRMTESGKRKQSLAGDSQEVEEEEETEDASFSPLVEESGPNLMKILEKRPLQVPRSNIGETSGYKCATEKSILSDNKGVGIRLVLPPDWSV
ncbi:hypothetical protein CDL15_Pgr006566 [Punica granatum]|uniref:Uncharacterized protein n=1 Tax=Punica granatum TaxID=22663 RepID=A0A218XYQ4_PUNGR|nr:hypothetical protein CDL15_Pgr006566 [Punica granatum]